MGHKKNAFRSEKSFKNAIWPTPLQLTTEEYGSKKGQKSSCFSSNFKIKTYSSVQYQFSELVGSFCSVSKLTHVCYLINGSF